MAAKKNIKRKKAAGSLLKFLKNRKSASIALGICLVVATSAYVTMAKFSADDSSGSWKEIGKVTYSVRVQNSNGELLENALVFADSSGDYDAAVANGPHRFSMGTISLGKTGPHGITSKEFKVCQKGGGTKRACYRNEDNNLMLIGKLVPKVMSDNAEKEVLISTHYFAGSTTKDSTLTIKLKKGAIAGKAIEGSAKSTAKTANSGTSASSNSSSSIKTVKAGGVILASEAGKYISLSIQVIDKKTKQGVGGITIGTNAKFIKKGSNKVMEGDWGKTNRPTGGGGFINYPETDICKDSHGWYYACFIGEADFSEARRAISVEFSISGSSASKNKVVQYNIPQPLAKSDAELNKKFKAYSDKSDLFFPTIYLYSDGSGGYIGKTWDLANKNGTTTTDTSPAGSKVSSVIKATTSKVSSAARTVTSKITKSSSSGVKVNTAPTSKDKATFSESLPGSKVNITKTLSYQIKNSKEVIPGTVKITVVYKECSAGGCGGATGDQFKQEAFTNGTGSVQFGVVNVPQVKKSLLTSKTTNVNRYFLYYGQTTKLVRRIYISDVNDGNKREINIGGYPFATNTLSAAEKFQLKAYTYYISGTLPTATSTQSSAVPEVVGSVQSDGNGPTDPEAAGRPAGN